MENSKSTKQLLETYYEGFARKEGWELVISEDFKFFGGDMTKKAHLWEKLPTLKPLNGFPACFKPCV